LIDYSLKDQLKDIFKPLMAGAITSLLVLYFIQVTDIHPLLQLFTVLFAGIGYLLLCVLFRAEGIDMLLKKLKQKLRRKSL
jgi:hypothetical protein